MKRELNEIEKSVLEELKKVKDPETESDIVSLGLVYGMTIKESYAEIWVSLARRLSVCPFCKALGWTIVDKITRDIVSKLEGMGFKRIKVVEAINPSIAYYGGEEE
ncbi:MAG: iron-sulfur cluster assembly protein [Synergistetes bacterium]|nr:iron-sulfur cluster assembly protein [Synergistota bacterium]MCX8128400.1 iron-sulfur cluster assembly protein [Synergistota bacterium]MDW8192435.1 iron-sulfur cluster assembly protein [Synergistota bacterium]